MSAEAGRKPYTIVNLDQGTRTWIEWRRQGIGASDAPTVMGENPWKSEEYLLREKTGRVREGKMSAVMVRGMQLEPEARASYIAESGLEVFPACLQSSLYSWQRASIDGFSKDGKSAVEIKCGKSVYESTASTRRVPGYYVGQLQHILSVTGLAEIDFWCYLPDCKGILLTVTRDEKYIARLIEKEREFWNRVLAVDRGLKTGADRGP